MKISCVFILPPSPRKVNHPAGYIVSVLCYWLAVKFLKDSTQCGRI
nr:MAG TPA_asm: hypothetical protein [Caudoviricetes sp.]